MLDRSVLALEVEFLGCITFPYHILKSPGLTVFPPERIPALVHIKMLPRPYLLPPIVSLALLCTVAVVLYSWDGSFSHIQRQICPKVSTLQTQRTFRPIKLLEKVDEEGTNTFESSLLPQNGGLLRVRMSNDTETVNDYGVSMFHQLHCLVTLREIIFPGGSPIHPEHTEHNSSMARVHWAHCFDYLAQVCRPSFADRSTNLRN